MACSFTKTAFRIGVIGALAAGAAVVIAEPARIHALFFQAKTSVNKVIDGQIQDPIALRAQLRDLESQYPKRIADVRGDLAELREQGRQLDRELAVSRRVVDLAAADLDVLEDVLAKAEGVRTDHPGHIIKVRFDDESLDLEAAYAKANRVSDLHGVYTTRIDELERDMGYLAQQEEQLVTLLDQLETEQAEFQTQLWQLDRQVDAIARNDRMIEMMAKRQQTIDEQSRYQAASLDQVHARFADIRARQEAQLESLTRSGTTASYEDRAKWDLDRAGGNRERFLRGRLPAPVEVTPDTIEVTPEADPLSISKLD